MTEERYTPRDVAGELRRARKAAGMTQAELADLVGMKRTAVADAERGKGLVKLARFLTILEALGVKLVHRRA